MPSEPRSTGDSPAIEKGVSMLLSGLSKGLREEQRMSNFDVAARRSLGLAFPSCGRKKSHSFVKPDGLIQQGFF